jgi:acetyl esterase/lipase
MRGAARAAAFGSARFSAVCLTLVLSTLACVACGDGGHQASSACPDAPVKHTVQYASYPGVDPNLNRLDLYLPAAGDPCRPRPIVVWVHGGGWEGGDKTDFMEHKIPLFNGAGYVFASVNYRLSDSTVPNHLIWPVHDDDTADALAWLIHHAREFGGDPHRIAVLGHSAGGGIVAAVATDDRYLGRGDLPLSAIKCAASMDGEGYDVVAGATTSPPEWRPTYTNAFGTDPAAWEEASPIRHVSADKGIPRYFVAARGIDWRLQQHLDFIDALQRAGVPVTVLDSRQLEHADLTTAVGDPNDKVVTPALMSFLQECFAH